MKFAHGAAGPLGLAMLFFLFATAIAQRSDVRRAQPADELPPPRALPIEETTAPPPPVEMVPPDRRQLEYANALFTRKLYDLAVPEYEKYLDEYPAAPGRARSKCAASPRKIPEELASEAGMPA